MNEEEVNSIMNEINEEFRLKDDGKIIFFLYFLIMCFFLAFVFFMYFFS